MDNSSNLPGLPSVADDLREAEKKFNESEEKHRREKDELRMEIQLKDKTINQLKQELATLKGLLLYPGPTASREGRLSRRRRIPELYFFLNFIWLIASLVL